MYLCPNLNLNLHLYLKTPTPTTTSLCTTHDQVTVRANPLPPLCEGEGFLLYDPETLGSDTYNATSPKSQQCSDPVFEDLELMKFDLLDFTRSRFAN